MFEYFLLSFQYSCEKNYGSSKSPRHGYLNPPLLEQFEPKVKGCSSLSKERGGGTSFVLPPIRDPCDDICPPLVPHDNKIIRHVWRKLFFGISSILHGWIFFSSLKPSRESFLVTTTSLSLSLFPSCVGILWFCANETREKMMRNFLVYCDLAYILASFFFFFS